MSTIHLKIGGMTCMGCVASVTKLLKNEPGVSDARVTLTPGAAEVEADLTRTSAGTLASRLEAAGYDAVESTGR
mgnify:CR=1 FL=1